jgi:HD-GYP domain-containing protein (c-di-GMP phosphodiesterase class II)
MNLFTESAPHEPEVARVLASDAFRAELLRSEHQRVLWFVAVLLAMLVFSVARNIAFAYGQHLLLVAVPIGVMAIGGELGQLYLVKRAERRRRAPPQWVWVATALLEASLPTFLLVGLAQLPSVGPERALVYPTVAIYFIIILLTTLHLRPAICFLSGFASAAGYFTVVAFAYGLPRPESAVAWLHPSVPATFGVLLLLAGVVAAGVAGQLRRRLLAALGQAELRRRAELRSRDTLIFALAKMAETRDADTGAHLERIAEYSALLAEALRERYDLNSDWIEQVRVAAPLHDIGKVGLPDDVLKKPGRLTPAERAIIQTHPRIGADALRAIEGRGTDRLLRLGAEIAAAHHERWDGGGYPAGLAGDDIPVAARIVALADVYDALTSQRVYKPPLTHAEARQIIEEASGTHFDPVVVTAFQARATAFDATRRRMQEVPMAAVP